MTLLRRIIVFGFRQLHTVATMVYLRTVCPRCLLLPCRVSLLTVATLLTFVYLNDVGTMESEAEARRFRRHRAVFALHLAELISTATTFQTLTPQR